VWPQTPLAQAIKAAVADAGWAALRLPLYFLCMWHMVQPLQFLRKLQPWLLLLVGLSHSQGHRTAAVLLWLPLFAEAGTPASTAATATLKLLLWSQILLLPGRMLLLQLWLLL
jgi:hypothetical protein